MLCLHPYKVTLIIALAVHVWLWNVPMSSFKGAGEFHYTIVKVLTWS